MHRDKVQVVQKYKSKLYLNIIEIAKVVNKSMEISTREFEFMCHVMSVLYSTFESKSMHASGVYST